VHAEDRKKKLIEAWQSGNYPSIKELADDFCMSRTHASKILKAAGVKD
jgi:hypothetical protein